jgi:hypothetical protein
MSSITVTFVFELPDKPSHLEWIQLHLMDRPSAVPGLEIVSNEFLNQDAKTTGTITVKIPAQAQGIFSLDDHLRSRHLVFPDVKLLSCVFCSDELQAAGFPPALNSVLTTAGLYSLELLCRRTQGEILQAVEEVGALEIVCGLLAALNPSRHLRT